MTDPFSPATRAVYDAFNRIGLYNEPSFDTDRKCLAAALRALAYNVYSDEIVTCGGSSYALVIERDDILAIADELEPRQ